jgi:hypothetical protein
MFNVRLWRYIQFLILGHLHHLGLSRLASEAVSWIAKEANIARPDAVRLGQRLQRLGLFHHCMYEHDFKDDMLFFRFAGTSFDGDEGKHPPGSYGAPVVGETLVLQGDVRPFLPAQLPHTILSAPCLGPWIL